MTLISFSFHSLAFVFCFQLTFLSVILSAWCHSLSSNFFSFNLSVYFSLCLCFPFVSFLNFTFPSFISSPFPSSSYLSTPFYCLPVISPSLSFPFVSSLPTPTFPLLLLLSPDHQSQQGHYTSDNSVSPIDMRGVKRERGGQTWRRGVSGTKEGSGRGSRRGHDNEGSGGMTELWSIQTWIFAVISFISHAYLSNHTLIILFSISNLPE